MHLKDFSNLKFSLLTYECTENTLKLSVYFSIERKSICNLTSRFLTDITVVLWTSLVIYLDVGIVRRLGTILVVTRYFFAPVKGPIKVYILKNQLLLVQFEVCMLKNKIFNQDYHQNVCMLKNKLLLVRFEVCVLKNMIFN